jgi:hypothetical protein
MPVDATELIAYCAATVADDDTDANIGGAIDPLRRVVFSTGDISAADAVEVISSSAGDTQNCTVRGRSAAGVDVSQTQALNGTTQVTFNNFTGGVTTIERVLSVELASVAIGTVTVRKASDNVTISTIPVGERGFRRLWIAATAQASGGSSETFYEKFFWKNTDGALSLLSAVVSQSADPTGFITHGLAAAVNDSLTTATRKTAPAGISFADTATAVPGTDLAAGAAIGVWLRMVLPAGTTPAKSSYTSQIAGTTA